MGRLGIVSRAWRWFGSGGAEGLGLGLDLGGVVGWRD